MLSENISNHDLTKKAAGVDRVTKDEYSINLDENLEDLVGRMKRGAYKPQPSRRVYLPKGGKDKMIPLEISSYEDKLVVLMTSCFVLDLL